MEASVSPETLVGRLSFDALGGAGTWTLTPERGPKVQLVGALDPALEGREVTVVARPAEQGFGFGMVGPVYEVVSVQPR